jgi:dipeptidyl-peptidase-4
MDGSGMKRLAENTGQYFWNAWQQIQFSPSKEYFICTRSASDQPAVSELRRADGTLVMQLSESDREALKKMRWKPPEEFSVKAADGKTDLYGLLFKPDDLDPNHSYPVIDFIYGGGHVSLMERCATFEPQWASGYGLAQQGYIVVLLDSRGTTGRSKAFRDVATNNSLTDYLIPDHVAALRQLAEERSYIDLDRVGVYGLSFGGYSTILAMLAAPDMFRVGISWDFGFGGEDDPVLLKLASNLKGKLLLIYGPQRESNERMARALIDANKFFDALPMPGADHSLLNQANRKYVNEAVRRYFDEHLNK